MDKQMVLCWYKGILRNKKKQATDTCSNVDKSQKHVQVTKENILYDFLDTQFKNRSN